MAWSTQFICVRASVFEYTWLGQHNSFVLRHPPSRRLGSINTIHLCWCNQSLQLFGLSNTIHLCRGIFPREYLVRPTQFICVRASVFEYTWLGQHNSFVLRHPPSRRIGSVNTIHLCCHIPHAECLGLVDTIYLCQSMRSLKYLCSANTIHLCWCNQSLQLFGLSNTIHLCRGIFPREYLVRSTQFICVRASIFEYTWLGQHNSFVLIVHLL